MKKYSVILAIILLGLSPLSDASAREKHIQFPDKKVLRYQGEFSLTGGLTSYGPNFGADILNGIRFNPYLYAGVGVGLEAGVAEWTAPIYLNVKGFAPISKKVNMYLGTDIGVKHWLGYSISRFYAGPEFGFNFEFGKRMGINLGIQYDIWCIPLTIDDVEVGNLNTFGIVLGLVF